MDSFIEVFSLLIIAIISFIAPVSVYLLSIFSDGVALIHKRTNSEKQQINAILSAQIISTRELDATLLKESTKKLNKMEKNSKTRVNLLNPKRQIIRVFLTLFMSLTLMLIEMLVKDPELNIFNHYTSIALVGGSIFCFGIGMLFLQQVAWAIIYTKGIIAEDKAAESIEPTDQTLML